MSGDDYYTNTANNNSLEVIKKFFTIPNRKIFYTRNKYSANYNFKFFLEKKWKLFLPPWASVFFNIKPAIQKPDFYFREKKKRIQLNELQKNALDKLLKKNFWLLHAPVGFWKTTLLPRFFWRLKVKTWIILTNTQINAISLYNIFKDVFDDVWIYYSNEKRIDNITIMTFSWFKKIYDELNWKFEALLIDEADLFFSNDAREKIILFNSYYKYWFTGTPYNSIFKKEDFEKFWWIIVESDKYQEKINKEFNVNVVCYNINWEMLEYYNYQDLRRVLLENKKYVDFLDSLIEWLKTKDGIKIILCDLVDFCSFISKRHNIPALTWQMSKKEKLAALEEMNNTGMIVTTQNILWRWYSNVKIKEIVILFWWRSKSRIIQSIWRWLRKSPNLTYKTIHIYDVTYNDRMLQRQLQERITFYKEFSNSLVIHTIY